MKNEIIKITTVGAIVALFAASFSSCSGESDEGKKNKSNTIDTTAANDTAAKVKVEVDYAVPTPNELFKIINKLDKSLDATLVNDVNKSSDYVTEKKKALNFGVYTADLAYLSAFGNSADAMNYFETIQSLGESLGISAAFDKALVERVEENQADADSIFMISNDTYFDTYAFLEENDKGSILSMIIVGGWVESMYVITNLVGDYKEGDPLMEDIGDQRLVLENILGFLEIYSDDQNVQQVTGDLFSILEAFDNMEFVEEKDVKIENKDGVITTSGGGYYKMNEQAFNAIKAAVADLRNQITE